MKEQINKYARGVFEYEPLLAKVSPAAVSDVVQKNQTYSGKIRVKENLSRELKGIAYSTNNRIHICNTQFIGEDCVIEYTVDTHGVEPGDRIMGYFNLVTNGGEEDVPFEFNVESGAYESELGNVKNLFHIANLAQTNTAEALKIFTSKEFPEVFFKDDLVMSKLHNQILHNADKRIALEEFLVAIHKKSRVNIKLDETPRYLSEIRDNSREVIELNKDVWGSVRIDVTCDADFIVLSKDKIDEDDFTGGKLEYVFEINSKKLHAGKNYARIKFTSPYEEKEHVVCIDNSINENGRNKSLAEKQSIVNLVGSYLNFRNHQINLNDWIALSSDAINELLIIDEGNPFYNLFKSQILVAEKKTNEAKFYLDSAKDVAVSARESDPVLYCYYLYVSTIVLRDPNYARETAQTVKSIYERECNNWKILWILLYLDVEMAKNKSLKLLRIKEQFNQGMRSPVLYLEACIILNEQPQLLRVLNDFEINVLLFGCKQGIVENKLLSQAADVALNTDARPGLLYKLLTKLYERSENVHILESICGILIRHGRTGKKYIKWYEAGIENGLKVTKLYEYYIASRDPKDETILPKMVLLYFGYNNELDLMHKAYVYANLLKYRDVYPQIFKNYYYQMQDFVKEVLADGRADENTGVVLREYLSADLINENNAVTAAKALFTYKVTCDNPRMRNVIVGHKETNELDRYPLNNGVAYVQIYTSEPCICFEDAYGRWYKESIEYDYSPVYRDDSVTKKLFNYCEGNLNLSLHFCEKHSRVQNTELDNIRLYFKTANSENIRPEFKQMLMKQVIDFYFDSYEGEDVEAILEKINVDELNETYLIKLIEALITHGKYVDAYNLTDRVREERINAKRVLKLCDQYLIDAENSEELFVPEQRFINLAYYAFSRGKYNDLLLRFLCMHYNGPTSDMLDLWEIAIDNAVDVYSLEERTIGQMLFSGHYSKKSMTVFEHYYNNGAKERIIEAFLEYNAYNYFVKDMVVAEKLFEIIETRVEADKDVSNGCKLALLKYYSEKDYLDVSQIDLARVIMEKMARRGYIFKFYDKFVDAFTLPHEVADKTIIEYHTNPSHRVIIHYVIEDSDEKEFTSVDMKNVYEGIFVKTFVLFYGENVEYYITEEGPDGEIATESMRVENRAFTSKHPEGRYEMINEMLGCRELHDNQSLDRQLHVYGVNNAIVDQLFVPLD